MYHKLCLRSQGTTTCTLVCTLLTWQTPLLYPGGTWLCVSKTLESHGTISMKQTYFLQTLLLAELTLGFDDTTYHVEEGDNIDICLSEINAELRREIVFSVVSIDGTAKCEHINIHYLHRIQGLGIQKRVCRG